MDILMEDVTEKYKNKDINDDTQIWSGDQTARDAKPLRETIKLSLIYLNLHQERNQRNNQSHSSKIIIMINKHKMH